MASGRALVVITSCPGFAIACFVFFLVCTYISATLVNGSYKIL